MISMIICEVLKLRVKRAERQTGSSWRILLWTRLDLYQSHPDETVSREFLDSIVLLLSWLEPQQSQQMRKFPTSLFSEGWAKFQESRELQLRRGYGRCQRRLEIQRAGRFRIGGKSAPRVVFENKSEPRFTQHQTWILSEAGTNFTTTEA